MFCAIIYEDEYGEDIIKVIGPFESEENAIDEALDHTDNMKNIDTVPFELIEGENNV